MRIYKILISAILLLSITIGNAQTKSAVVLPKKVSMDIVPVEEIGLMIDQTEVSMLEYLSFVETERKKNNSIEFATQLIQASSDVSPAQRLVFSLYVNALNDVKEMHTLVLKSKYKHDIAFSVSDDELKSGFGKFGNYSDSLSKIVNLPVTGLSMKQALAYANWKAEMLNQDKAVKGKYKFRGRLISPEEMYKLLDIAGPREPQNTDSNPDSISAVSMCYVMNVKYLEACPGMVSKERNYGRHSLIGVNQMLVDRLGLYNIYGNAAEMTSTPGLAIGGSYMHFALEAFNRKSQAYTTSSSQDEQTPGWVGFRVVYEPIK